MRFFLVRHGETLWNVQRLIQGSTDIPLTPAGIQQAEDFARENSDFLGHSFCAAYSSDLGRAAETARILCQASNPKRELIYTEFLRERMLGEYEGRPLKEYIVALKDWEQLPEDLKWTTGVGGSETFAEVRSRIYSVMESIVAEDPTLENVLLVSHSDTLRSIYMDILQKNGDELSLAQMVGFHNLGYIIIEMSKERSDVKLIEVHGASLLK